MATAPAVPPRTALAEAFRIMSPKDSSSASFSCFVGTEEGGWLSLAPAAWEATALAADADMSARQRLESGTRVGSCWSESVKSEYDTIYDLTEGLMGRRLE
jgi:hypothetical protein